MKYIENHDTATGDEREFQLPCGAGEGQDGVKALQGRKRAWSVGSRSASVVIQNPSISFCQNAPFWRRRGVFGSSNVMRGQYAATVYARILGRR